MRVSAACLLLCALSADAAENLLPSGGFEDEALIQEWGQPSDVIQELDDQMEGAYSLRFLRTGYATSPETIEVDPTQSYTLRASLKIPENRMAPDSGDFSVLIRLVPHDAGGNPIASGSVHAFPETETTLAKAAQEGDSSVFLVGEAWEKRNLTLVAFGALPDLGDLPNPDVADIAEVVPGSDNTFEVRLAAPLARSHGAGTAVRMHRHAPFPMIVAEPSTEWVEHSLQLEGSSEPGKISENQFWHGTQFVKVQIKPVPADLSNPNLPIDLLLDGVSFGP